jgi:hypothetical protein
MSMIKKYFKVLSSIDLLKKVFKENYGNEKVCQLFYKH